MYIGLERVKTVHFHHYLCSAISQEGSKKKVQVKNIRKIGACKKFLRPIKSIVIKNSNFWTKLKNAYFWPKKPLFWFIWYNTPVKFDLGRLVTGRHELWSTIGFWVGDHEFRSIPGKMGGTPLNLQKLPLKRTIFHVFEL